MSIFYRAFARLAVLALFFVGCFGNVCAEPVTWTLSGVTFSDGGTASGSFVYDADNPVSYVVSSWSIAVAGGDTTTFPPIIYDQTSSTAYYATNSPTDPMNYGLVMSLNGSDRGLRLPGTSTFTNAGGTIPVNIAGSGAGECYNCGPARSFAGGNLIGTAPPSVTSAAATSFLLNTAGSFTVTATGAPVPAIAVTGTLPTGVIYVDNGDGTGTIAGTPTSAGNYPLTITASNTTGPDAPQSFTLAVDQAPTITSAGTATVNAGNAVSFAVTTTGFPAPGVSVAGTLPGGITFTDNGDGTGTFGGTAAANAGGEYALVITASNGIGADATQNFTLTVDQPAQITSAAFATFTTTVPGSFTVTSSGYPLSALSIVGTLPAGITFVDNGNGTGTFAGTAPNSAKRNYVIGISAINSSGSAKQSFSLSVVDVSPIPTLGGFGLLLAALLISILAWLSLAKRAAIGSIR